MKLSAKEVKLITDLSTRRKRRKWDAWLSFLSAIAQIAGVPEPDKVAA